MSNKAGVIRDVSYMVLLETHGCQADAKKRDPWTTLAAYIAIG